MVYKSRKGSSLSATSIDTEENSLGVPKARYRVLIYMRGNKHGQRVEIQVQRAALPLSKYLYRKGNGHQEVIRTKVSIKE